MYTQHDNYEIEYDQNAIHVIIKYSGFTHVCFIRSSKGQNPYHNYGIMDIKGKNYVLYTCTS